MRLIKVRSCSFSFDGYAISILQVYTSPVISIDLPKLCRFGFWMEIYSSPGHFGNIWTSSNPQSWNLTFLKPYLQGFNTFSVSMSFTLTLPTSSYFGFSQPDGSRIQNCVQILVLLLSKTVSPKSLHILFIHKSKSFFLTDLVLIFVRDGLILCIFIPILVHFLV